MLGQTKNFLPSYLNRGYLKYKYNRTMDLDNIISELMNKNIMLSLRTNSPSFKKYGKQLRGRLTGQLWGIKAIGDIYNETVTALKIIRNSFESEIPTDDIDFIIEDKYVG